MAGSNLIITRSLFQSASPVYEDVPSVAITQGSMVIHVADQEELHAAAKPRVQTIYRDTLDNDGYVRLARV